MSLTIPRDKLNTAAGVLGIFLLCIGILWIPGGLLGLKFSDDPLIRNLISAIFQTMAVIVLPYFWAAKRLGLSPRTLGVTTKGLKAGLFWGLALYALALMAFIHCSDDPLISNHAVRSADYRDLSIMLFTMCLVAAGTDLTTRGFLLLTLAESTNVYFAIAIQNLAWVVGHIVEIKLLMSCLGLELAVALTITLGVLGDIVALKTRNVVGLAIAHIVLNIALVTYIRTL